MASDFVLVNPKAGEYELLGLRPPDSLLSVAAVPDKEGLKVKIIDQRVKGWEKELDKELKANPAFVGLSAMTGQQITHALEISKIVKEKSLIPVVWGGIHPSLLPEQTLENENIDIVVKGEGDFAVMEICNALQKGKGLEKVNGVFFKKNGKIVQAPERPLIKNLDDLPGLPYHLVNLENYYGMNYSGGKSITLMTSRGCPFGCKFCYNTVYYKKTWRANSVKRSLEKIRFVVEELGIKDIYFQDDNFCANQQRFEGIIKGMLKEKWDLKWGLLGARASSLIKMSQNFLEDVKKAGCENIDVGVESGSPRILEMIDKSLAPEDVIVVNKKLAKTGIKTKYTFIGGFPTETKYELQMTVNLALKLAKENPHAYTPFFIYTPYPGTELFEFSKKHGFEPPKKLAEWGHFGFFEWYNKYKNWLSREEIAMLENLMFSSRFANKNIKQKIKNPLMRLAFDLYHPIGKFRFEKNFYKFAIEWKLEKLLTGKN